MTHFEEFAIEVLGKVETDSMGFYTKHTAALANLTNEIILSDDEEIFEMPWEEQKEIIMKNFFATFPYLEK